MGPNAAEFVMMNASSMMMVEAATGDVSMSSAQDCVQRPVLMFPVTDHVRKN